MTAPRRQNGRDVAKFEKSCTNKYRYADEHAARAIAQTIITQGKSKTGSLWVYACEGCRGWHVTSLNNGRRFKVTAEHLIAPDANDPFAGLSK